LGIGIVVGVGESTGGTDIPPLIFHKFFNFPVSAGMWILDISIVFLQFAAKVTVENILYGVLITLCSSIIVDKVALIGSKRAQVKILSKKTEEIRKMILNKLNRGVTLLSGKTGFLKNDCFMVMTIVSFRDVVKLRNAVQKIDPDALFMVSTISEVRGRGFSSERIALPKTEEKDGDVEDLKEVAVQEQAVLEEKETQAPVQETAGQVNTEQTNSETKQE
ncbi:MAG: YitT family protein, partial [Clostridia bacterium]|nr:YitT family protein [Clostridia bacterium]